jgi:hypothetical protein
LLIQTVPGGPISSARPDGPFLSQYEHIGGSCTSFLHRAQDRLLTIVGSVDLSSLGIST